MPSPFRERTWRPIPDADVAWIAGLLEGEGSFISSGRDLPRVCMQSTDEDIIDRLVTISGVGHKYGPLERPDRKAIWMWSCQRILDVVPLLIAIRPQMGERRGEKIDDILRSLRETRPQLFTDDR